SFNKNHFNKSDEFEIKNETYLLIPDPVNICCAYGNCQKCCESGECLDKTPLILLHGHGFSIGSPDYSTDTFNILQYHLIDEGHMPGNIISPGQNLDFYKLGDLGRVNTSFVFKSTYYSVTYFDEIGYITGISKTQNIDTYAIRLKEIIDYTKLVTGKDKVD